jgi:transcriptional regulator with XRE-family HTH domain
MRSMRRPTTDMTTESFLDWLDRRRQERGISWRELARQAGIGHGTLDNYRRNPAAVPELPTLMKIADWAGEPLGDVQRRVNITPSPLPRTVQQFRYRGDRITLRKPKLRKFVKELLAAPDLDPALVSSILDNLEKKLGIVDN